MQEQVFELKLPRDTVSFAVFSSPHSGCHYPRDFLDSSPLSRLALRSSEDAFVNDLFSSVPDLGAPLLSARFPRAYVDLNRAADELDPAMIEGAAPSGTNPRLAAGLGVIPRVVSDNREIRRGKLTLAEAKERLDRCYYPYHRMLWRLLAERKAMLGGALLFDLHSMPSEALAVAPNVVGRKPDIVLGNRFGASSAAWIMDATCEAFRAQDFVVARNAPFAGGHITRYYGNPAENIHCVQIEIDRALYMDEAAVSPNKRFGETRARLEAVSRDLVRIGQRALRFAAE